MASASSGPPRSAGPFRRGGGSKREAGAAVPGPAGDDSLHPLSPGEVLGYLGAKSRRPRPPPSRCRRRLARTPATGRRAAGVAANPRFVAGTEGSAGPVAPTPTPIKHSPTTEPGDPALNTGNSFWLDNYPLNDLYQYLARQAGYQFFQNPFIDAIRVTGELFKGRDPWPTCGNWPCNTIWCSSRRAAPCTRSPRIKSPRCHSRSTDTS